MNFPRFPASPSFPNTVQLTFIPRASCSLGITVPQITAVSRAREYLLFRPLPHSALRDTFLVILLQKQWRRSQSGALEGEQFGRGQWLVRLVGTISKRLLSLLAPHHWLEGKFLSAFRQPARNSRVLLGR